jgi:hypothetical protein
VEKVKRLNAECRVDASHVTPVLRFRGPNSFLGELKVHHWEVSTIWRRTRHLSEDVGMMAVGDGS